MVLTSKKLWISITTGVWLVSLFTSRSHCDRAWFAFGIDVERCPDGEVRQTAVLEIAGLRRGGAGSVVLQSIAHYTTGEADGELRAQVPGARSIELALVGADKVARLLPVDHWDGHRDAAMARLTLPEVPDGDYQLRARYETQLGAGEVTVALPLYTPARIHVITDRPLYEPGNTVRFRAVVLRARDLAPLDQRPGVWTIRDPENEVLLEEAAPAGAWGVVAGSFPLDKAARIGEWKVGWRSADAVDEVAFTVAPFTLPRFRVDALAARPFYAAGERPTIKGAVLYSSGAPVAAARLEISWSIDGDWPPPTTWQATDLPRVAQAAANGRFELALPQIPDDLQGTATLTAQISAVDPAGDRATGVAAVLLSQDGIQASAVTELGDGLVESFNNRIYVRVATPDGRVVANTDVTVRRAWQPDDRGVVAALDEDGVASLQLDPGAPVNIVIPARPWRPAPRPRLVSRGDARELIGGQGAPLADQVGLDRWLAAFAPCAKWSDLSASTTQLGVRVDRAGRVIAATATDSALDRCVVAIAKQQRLPSGADRMYAVGLELTDPGLPRLVTSIDSTLAAPPGFAEAIATLVRGARDCLPSGAGPLASLLAWRARAGAKDVELAGWLADPAAAGGRAAQACVAAHLEGTGRIALAAPAPADTMGVVRFAVELPVDAAQPRPQPTTMLGYELLVSADLPGQPSTKLRVAPGRVPALRMRVTPVLASPGGKVTAELIRGPSFTSKLPEKLVLACLKQRAEERLDAAHRATLQLDPKVEGWCTISGGGAAARIYVQPAAGLSVTIVPRKDRYAPGEQAELAIQTTLGGKGGAAAVGLFGVDDSLGQLVPLPGPDALGRVRPRVETSAPAFGVLDGQALTLGRIRGANAAAATVLRVSATPTPAELDAVASGRAESAFDPIAELTDRFYIVLAELHTQARAWEAKAPAGEKMTPATMARLWGAAVAACAQRGQRVDDAYGRRLRLTRLPPDLLALTDPRAVVVVATRLPEDVENWPAWVARERP
jgi:hypothetical protein